MKKTIYMILFLFLVSINPSFGVSLQEQKALDTILDNIEQGRGELSEEKKQKQRNTLHKMITQAPHKESTANIVEYILKTIEHKVNKKEEHEILSEQVEDIGSIRKSWLAQHNQERSKRGLHPYTYNYTLEQTAQKRAEYIAEERRTTSTHTRPGSNRYYSYDHITDRFNNQGVDFLLENNSSFSESIGYGYSRCQEDELCDNLVQDTQSTRNFFMSEQTYNGPHYRAITHPYFNEIGIGIAINNKRYYIVIHYGTETIIYEQL